MTVQSIVWVLEKSKAEARTRCVAFALANRFDANEPLSCWPGMERIAGEGKMAERTAQRCVDELVLELQELVVILNAGGPPNIREDRRPNLYIFPQLLGRDRLREVLAEYPRELIKIGSDWKDCAPPGTATGCQSDTPSGPESPDANDRADLDDDRTTGCQPDTPSTVYGVSEIDARGDRNTTRGVSEIDARGDTVDTQSHIDPSVDPSVDPTTPLALGFARPPKKARARDELWDSMVAACGLAGVSPTSTERGAWNRAVKDLREVEATPAEIERRARAFHDRWPSATLTPTALARRWNEVVAGSTAATIQPAPIDPLDIAFDPKADYWVTRALRAVELLASDIRTLYGIDLLIEGALACLEQNPTVHPNDLSLAAELYAENHETTVAAP